MKISLELEWSPRMKRIARGTIVLAALGILFAAAAPIDTSWIRPGQPVSSTLLKGNLDDLQAQIIVQDTTLNVPAQYATIQAAWASLQRKVIRARVIIKLADGTYTLPAGGLELHHPDGALISIVGNTTMPGNVIVNAMDQGFIVNEGSAVGLIDGLRLTGPSTATSLGVVVMDRSSSTIGPNISIVGFNVGLRVERQSLVNFKGGNITGLGSNSGAVEVFAQSHFDAVTLDASNCSVAVFVSKSSSAWVHGGSASSVYGALWVETGSSGVAGAMTVTLASASGAVAWRAALGSTLFVSATNLASFSPMPGVVGNSNAIIGQ